MFGILRSITPQKRNVLIRFAFAKGFHRLKWTDKYIVIVLFPLDTFLLIVVGLITKIE
jgi:hypothetical protein